MKKKDKIIELENLLFLSQANNSGLVKRNSGLISNLNALELCNANLRKENKVAESKLNLVEARLNAAIDDLRQSETFLTSAESALNHKEMRENDNAEFIAKILRNYNDR